ncbi:MAG: U32 family peptidase [Clostridium sp.]|uniref:peptidase U32 family protein n=1 Tax=Clostridium sp. TaxID=1506 RepID=UPI00305E9CEB
MKTPELLAPAGNLEKLKAAINFGADAVYLGGSKLNLRAFADNFSNEQLLEGIEFAHSRDKKVYVTLNVFPHNEDLEGLEDYLRELYEAGVDAIIVSDPGIIMISKETVPNLEIHLSTQANTVNWKTCEFWHKMGVKRVVLARELSLEEVTMVQDKIPETMDVEIFVHGSMCMAYSGRCVISNYMVGRDANRGSCAQPCRYKYSLVEEKREGEYYPVIEDDRGSYIMNSKDLCMIEHIPELMKTGALSFKIEGRMKSTYYVASVVKAYREAIDEYMKSPEDYKFNPKWLEDLNKPSHREYYTGFYLNEENKQVQDSSAYIRNYDIVGMVKAYDKVNKIVTIEHRNKVVEGATVEVLRPVGSNVEIVLNNLHDEKGNKIDCAPSSKMIYTAVVDVDLEENDIIIKAKEEV